MQVELRDRHVGIDSRDRQPRQFERRLGKVLERQTHLEQWVPRGRPSRVEDLDETLERNVRVRERAEIRLAGLLEEFGEARLAIHTVRKTRVLANMPIRSSSSRSARPAIGVPIAMSSLADTRARNTAKAVCSTMNSVVLV